MDEVHLPFHVSKKIQNNCPMFISGYSIGSKVSSYFFNQLISSRLIMYLVICSSLLETLLEHCAMLISIRGGGGIIG